MIKLSVFFEDLEADDFCSNLEITLVALRIPHALGVNRNGVVAELEVVGGLQRYVNDACRGSEEVGIIIKYGYSGALSEEVKIQKNVIS